MPRIRIGAVAGAERIVVAGSVMSVGAIACVASGLFPVVPRTGQPLESPNGRWRRGRRSTTMRWSPEEVWRHDRFVATADCLFGSSGCKQVCRGPGLSVEWHFPAAGGRKNRSRVS